MTYHLWTKSVLDCSLCCWHWNEIRKLFYLSFYNQLWPKNSPKINYRKSVKNSKKNLLCFSLLCFVSSFCFCLNEMYYSENPRQDSFNDLIQTRSQGLYSSRPLERELCDDVGAYSCEDRFKCYMQCLCAGTEKCYNRLTKFLQEKHTSLCGTISDVTQVNVHLQKKKENNKKSNKERNMKQIDEWTKWTNDKQITYKYWL